MPVALPGLGFKKNLYNALRWLPGPLRTPEAIELLAGTAARETRLGKFGDTPGAGGVGVFQVNPKTEEDIWSGYLAKRPKLRDAVIRNTGVAGPSPEALSKNFPYSAAIARLVYTRALEPIPRDPLGLANYWKQHYNTPAGAGTPEGFLETYHELIKGGKR